MMYRLLALLFIFGCTLFGVWWCALPVVAVYITLYGGIELIAAAFCIDAMFGGAVMVPAYTLGTTAIYIAITWLRPRFMFYTE